MNHSSHRGGCHKVFGFALSLLLMPLAVAIGATPVASLPGATGATTVAEAAQLDSEKLFSFSLAYGVNSDLADQLRPRIFNHTLNGSGSYNVRDWFQVTAGVGAFFTTLGSSVSKYKEDSGISSVSLGLSRSLSQDLGTFLGAKHSASIAVSGGLPLTEESQIEGYLGNIGAGPVLSSSFFDGILNVTNVLSYSQIFNRYEFSPFDGTAIPTSNYSYTLGAGVKLIWNLKVGASFGVRRSRYTDGFTDFSYNNTQSLSWAAGAWSAALTHTNGGYTDDGEVSLWYVDRYRRLVSGTIGYSF